MQVEKKGTDQVSPVHPLFFRPLPTQFVYFTLCPASLKELKSTNRARLRIRIRGAIVLLQQIFRVCDTVVYRINYYVD